MSVLLASPRAFAQPTVPYEVVDPGVADATALGDSLRLVPVDLRTPTAFDRVFRLPTVVGGEMFARMDGGLTAVFSQSEYARGRALIPAGTTWYIGPLPRGVFGLPTAPRPASPSAVVSNSASGRIDTRVPERPEPEPEVHSALSANPLMPWAGELERGARVGTLLERAARAERMMRAERTSP